MVSRLFLSLSRHVAISYSLLYVADVVTSLLHGERTQYKFDLFRTRVNQLILLFHSLIVTGGASGSETQVWARPALKKIDPAQESISSFGDPVFHPNSPPLFSRSVYIILVGGERADQRAFGYSFSTD